MVEGDAERGLALERSGIRFADGAVERAYRDWVADGSVGQSRVAAVGVVLIFVCAQAAAVARSPWLVWATLPMFLATYVAVGARLYLLHVAPRNPRNIWLGAAVVAAGHWGGAAIVSHWPEVAVGAAIFATLFAFATPSDGRPIALIGAGVFLPIAQGLDVARWRAGTLGDVAFGFDATFLWTSLVVGALMWYGNVLASHRAYRQERIIEAQKLTIARERARTEELLKRELSHQVAERSRELGAVLAKSDVTLDVRRLSPGERFAERYKIVAALGAGGMGAVYEVERVTDSARLALKVVVGEVSGASAARFAREAEIGARLRHPNLISIVDVGVSSGVPFLAMELVRGGSLESQRSKFGDVAWALPILKQIAEGLAALHDAGVVHRDLKPANVLLADGVAKISDFGISRFGELDDSSADANAATMAATPKRSAELTGTGVVMGTPLYMAPEGAKSARALDASADVFALGIIAYEMLTGRAPFPVPAFVLAMAGQPIPAPPAIEEPRVAADLRGMITTALAGEPAMRPRVRALLPALG